MSLKNYFLAFFLFSSIINYAQKNQEIDSSYVDYFNLTREIPYLHLNKTTFSKGQEIWFQAYVLNLNTKKLHNKTTNLFVSLYREDGTLKNQKLLYIENGIASGNFLIDSTYTDRNYFIRASTNWMKNFIEDESYIQKIKIIENKKKTNKLLDSELDIQLLPEGGHLLTSTVNTLGVIVKDRNNKGIKIKKGIILNQNNDTITTFKTNFLGYGKFQLNYKKNESYKAIFSFADRQVVVKKITPAKQNGVILSLFNPNSTFVKAIIKTNNSTLPALVDKKYSLYIHNINSLIKLNFTFNKESNDYEVVLNTKKLPAGINIVTLFNEKKQPISERLFFNYKKSLFTQPKVSFKKTSLDSLLVSVEKLNEKDSLSYSLSASFLPQNSQSYEPTNTIFTKFLLKPYIKGDVQNSRFYFENINRKKLNNLDLVLLTQGWSKYKWNNIFNSPPKNDYPFENGITIEGTINSKNTKRINEVFVMSKENNLFLSAIVNDNKFSLKNLFLKENSHLNFSIIKGKRGKKINTDLQFSPNRIDDAYKFQKNEEIDTRDRDFNNFTKDRVLLDEVIIKAKTKSRVSVAGIPGMLKRHKITEKTIKHERLIDFIRSRGFFIADDEGRIDIFNRRGLYSKPSRPRVLLDGRVILDEGLNDLKDIEYLTVRDIDEVVTSSLGNGEIHVFSKKITSKKRENTAFLNSQVPFGYSMGKEYYQPKKSFINGEDFNKYGAISWKPNITIDSNKKDVQFKVSTSSKETVVIYFEGISSDGALFMMKKTINFK